MQHDETLCGVCAEAIRQTPNGGAVTLCADCDSKDDAVQEAIAWRAAMSGQMVHLNVGAAPERSRWPLVAAAVIVVIGLVAAVCGML